MSELVRYLILVCVCSGFTAPASINAAPQGFLDGQLKIISASPVALDDENPSRPIDGKAAAAGAETEMLGARQLDLPMYGPQGHYRTAGAQWLVEAARHAHAHAGL